MAAGHIKYVVFDLDDTLYNLGARGIAYAAGNEDAMAWYFRDLQACARVAGINLRIVALTAKAFPDDITDDFIRVFSDVLDHPAVVKTAIARDGSSLVSYNHCLGRALLPRGTWRACRHFIPVEQPAGQLPLVNIIQDNVSDVSDGRRVSLTDKGAALAWMAGVTGVPIGNFILVDDTLCMRKSAERVGAEAIDASGVFNRDPRTKRVQTRNPRVAFAALMELVKARVLGAGSAAAAGPREHRDDTAEARDAWAEGEGSESDGGLSTAGGRATGGGAVAADPASPKAPPEMDSRRAEPFMPAWQRDTAAAIEAIAETWRGNGRSVQADALVTEWHSLRDAGLSAVQGALANPRSDFSHLLNTGASRWAFCCCCGGTSVDYLKVCEIVPRAQGALAAAVATDKTPLLG